MDDEESLVGEGEGEGGEVHAAIEPEVEEEEEELESLLTVYDPDDFISGAVTTLDSTLPVDLFEFEYAYGYDCHKNFNLCACDETVVCWAAGSIVTFMDVVTKQTWFRRSTTGGSIGNITSYRTDPNYRIAIAEGREGPTEPVIIIYTWPQMEIDAVLRDGTTNAYSIMDFSPNGELLASVGKEPDYNITIWTWMKHRILLRTSAFTFDVNAVLFSPYCPGQLTTAGAAHIKFWKMAQTFTGLKLKGDLGRFGKTEICDVLGVYPMPDEKVLSGCEWGNVLVWEAGLVKVEVTQRGRKRCHKGPVIQFMLSPAGYEVTTIAKDGCIRAWYWDTVEQADPPEEDPYIELNPVAETCVPECQIMCLRHQKDMYWYAQDGNGGIWTVDLELDKVQCDHNKVMTSHAGGIVGLAALRTHPILITAGKDGTLQAYSTTDHRLLAKYHFTVPIKCMLYPPVDVDESSRIILVGFADGIMRTLFLYPDRMEEQETMIEIKAISAMSLFEQGDESSVIDLISILKPHSKAINQITINAQRTRLVTCGEDSTIFMYQLVPGMPFQLNRIGFIETPNNIAFMTWKPEEEHVLLLCGQVGLLMEAVLPVIEIRKYSDITTFKLEFVDWKETIVKKNFMRHRPFPTEEDLASLDEEALKAAGEAEKDDDEEEEWLGEIELMESESMLGTTITWAEYCEEGIWVIQRGTGALLLVRTGVQKVLKYAPIPGAWCEDLTCLKFICEGKYLLFGTNTGYIRVVRMPTEEEDNPEHHYIVWMKATTKLMKKLKGRRLAKEEPQPIPRIDFTDTYYLAMHDRYTGALTGLEFSADGQLLYTCGADGNIFSFNINFSEPLISLPEEKMPPEISGINRIPEPSTMEAEMMSHEQLKQKEEYDKMMAIANAHKKRVRDELGDLLVEYNILIKLNRNLPVSQQIDVTLDPRPLEVQERELEEAKALTIRKLAHQLEASDLGLHKMHSRNIVQLDVFPFVLKAIRDPNVMIRPLRQKNLSKAFSDQLEEVYRKMAEAALRGRRAESLSRRPAARRPSWFPPRVASFLLGLPPNAPHPLKKALRNYHQRLNRHHAQFIEWQEHLFRKPDPNALPPGAAEALKEAEATIGNRLLKTDPDYVAPPGHNTQLRLCLTRKEIHDNKRAFNEKVLELRKSKVAMVDQMKKIGERLAEIRLEIPPKLAKRPPSIPQIDEELEFPEKNLEVKPEPIVMGPRLMGRGKKSEADRTKTQMYPVARTRVPRVPPFVPLMESRPLTATWELLKPRQDQEASPIEVEIRDRRIERHLYEQDMLLADAEVSVQQFDARLRKLQRERIRVQENNQLLELHLYQMHQEMNVLNRFEAHEDRLAERVYSKLMQVRGVQEQIADCEHRIEDHKAEKDQLDLSCQEMQRQFKKLVQDNKFADFLRRIFKKKYRQPRVHDDDESSEESESSSSSEEDEGSLDSRDIGPIRLDPNVCPEGCDPEVYQRTFELRNNRHKFEQDMIEQDRNVDFLRKDIEAHNKVKRKLSLQLDKRKRELREFMLEKQSCMNEVTQVVVLRYDQIRSRALQGCTGPDGLSKAVVFPEQLLIRLRNRVLELQEEIRQQKLRQKINRTHLHRMNIDIRAMEATAEDLRAQMRDVLTKKLGKPRKVDKTLDDLLRQMARRHKFSATMEFMPQMLQQIREWKERYSDTQKKYFSALENYSDRLRKAAALQADIFLRKPLRDPFVMPGAYTPDQYLRDVVRLRIVRSQQQQHINALKEEIQQMRTKPLSEIGSYLGISPPDERRSEIELSTIPRKIQRCKKYFPIAPLSTDLKIHDVNVMKLLFDCLDSMRVTRDDADQLLEELTAQLPAVLTGAISRYEVVDNLVRKWLLKYGGDPAMYKKQTRAFDALAALSDKLIKDHLKTLEGATGEETKALESLEAALRVVAGSDQPLHERLAPALAALLAAADTTDIETDETMASLVNSLMDENSPLTTEAIDKIDSKEVVHDIKVCGIQMDSDDIERIVVIAIESLRAQVVSQDEAAEIDDEVTRELSIDQKSSRSGSATARTDRSLRSTKTDISKTSVTSKTSATSKASTGSKASAVTKASTGSKTSAVTKASVVSKETKASEKSEMREESSAAAMVTLAQPEAEEAVEKTGSAGSKTTVVASKSSKTSKESAEKE